jgi:hypothetical protein
VILAVDAVAFCPLVTITVDDKMKGLKDFHTLADDDLFGPFLRDPNAFAEFLG